jgi:hypothetical protein
MDLFKILGISAGVGLIGYLGYLANLQQGIQIFYSLLISVKTWWVFKVPAKKVLQQIADNKTEVHIFVRDFFIQPNAPLFVQEGLNGPVGMVPNVHELWPRVEGIGLAKILNALGQIEKVENIKITEMGKDPGIWDKNLIILGAQTQKCFDFYSKMGEVAYKVTAQDIIKQSTGTIIKRDPKYGYGIILKCKNPFVPGNKGIGMLIGGYGVLGTEAATHYFSQHLAELGKDFGNKSFGIVVKALVSAGVQSTERIKKYDIKF